MRVVDDGPTFEVLRNRATLERASLVPPQVVEVVAGDGAADAAAGRHAVACANTEDEMEAAVLARVGARAAAGGAGRGGAGRRKQCGQDGGGRQRRGRCG